MSFSEIAKSNNKFLIKPKYLLIIAVVLATLLVASALIELIQVKKEIHHILSEEAQTLIEAVSVASDNAALAYSELENQVSERLLNNAKMIERLSREASLSQQDLAQIALDNNIYRINIFDRYGRKEIGSYISPHKNLEALHSPKDFIQQVLNGEVQELIIGFKESRHGLGQRYAVAVRRQNGGAVVCNIDTKEMLGLRKEIGLGSVIRELVLHEGILYVVIQDTVGIIAASSNITSLPSVISDAFLAKILATNETDTRLTAINGTETFEVAAPFLIDGLIRVGLAPDHITETSSRNLRRLAIITVILLSIGVLLFNLIVTNQNYHLVDEAYLRTKTYTGNILNNMNEAVIAIDRNKAITLFNPAAETLFNISSRDALGKTCSELIQSNSLLENTLAGQGLKEHETEYNVGSKKLQLSFNTFALKDKDGNIDSAVAVIRDLTEKKAMEQSLQRNEKLTAMGELASGVAHEVRNPLNAIGMVAQRLNKEFTTTSDVVEYHELTGTIVSEVSRLNDIIQRFLKLTKPAKLNKTKTSLSKLIDEVLTLIRAEAAKQEKNILMEYRSSEIVNIDIDQMKQVLLNILENSLQATKTGDDIRIQIASEDNFVFIEISDNGQGIAPENFSKIFDIYFTTKDSGTGMGLSIANQIVSAHGGEIKVESEINQGTTFTIKLPKS